MRNLLYVLAISTAIYGCASPDQVGPEVPVPPAARQAVMSSVAGQMKDPYTAQFRNWHAFESNHGLVVCGEVNAKNGFGGYVGFVHFIGHASPDGRLLTPTTVPDADKAALWDGFWASSYPGCY